MLLRDRSLVSSLFRSALRLPPPPTYNVPPHLGGHEDITQLDEGAFDYLVTHYGAHSMLDVGCGAAGMVYYAKAKGMRAVGIDGDPTVARDFPDILEHDYATGPLDAGEFDLGWAVEFVEHVEERFLPNYMVTFRGCKRVFITAAVPGQPGHHHVNCQPSDYWIARFREAGFELDQEVTEQARLHSTMWSRFAEQTGLVFERVE